MKQKPAKIAMRDEVPTNKFSRKTQEGGYKPANNEFKASGKSQCGRSTAVTAKANKLVIK